MSFPSKSSSSRTKAESVDSREATPPSSTSSSSAATPADGPAVPILNLVAVSRPFKNHRYSVAKKSKNLKQILAQEKTIDVPLDMPTYSNIEAPPSLMPQKKYCDITGLEAKYTDPKTSLRYHSAQVYQHIKLLGVTQVQEHLAGRGAAVVLR
ncbi:YL1 nuclear protein C-terminal domain-containing protein [Jimgerdemannia flammicorona]|uniref:YL1 nuclear protein C-terminal domain-containing protein n=1 Tax=Jimgerdemannia flammicorona TaxID=994334 RepID=A0A433DN27_9FUNG|nr:YL1 nuclear protein C-terminal domain-containing protein [Jimgerdemannia flammicorona]